MLHLGLFGLPHLLSDVFLLTRQDSACSFCEEKHNEEKDAKNQKTNLKWLLEAHKDPGNGEISNLPYSKQSVVYKAEISAITITTFWLQYFQLILH